MILKAIFFFILGCIISVILGAVVLGPTHAGWGIPIFIAFLAWMTHKLRVERRELDAVKRAENQALTERMIREAALRIEREDRQEEQEWNSFKKNLKLS